MNLSFEIGVFLVLVVGLVLLLVFFRLGEKKRMRQKTVDALSPRLREEIEREREENLEKRQKFENAMNIASGGGSPSGESGSENG